MVNFKKYKLLAHIVLGIIFCVGIHLVFWITLNCIERNKIYLDNEKAVYVTMFIVLGGCLSLLTEKIQAIKGWGTSTAQGALRTMIGVTIYTITYFII